MASTAERGKEALLKAATLLSSAAACAMIFPTVSSAQGAATGLSMQANVADRTVARVIRAAAYDQSCSREIRSARSVRAIMSNAAKCM